MQASMKICRTVHLLMLVVGIWIYCVGGGMMEQPWEMMKSMMGMGQKGKNIAIPIPIPLFIKETGNSQQQQSMMMQKPKKSKDWIWKLMMLKMMKGKKDKGCQSKTIIFPSKGGKGCCKMEMMMTTTTTTPEPDEYEDPYEYPEEG